MPGEKDDWNGWGDVKKQEAATEFPHPDVGGPLLAREQRGHILPFLPSSTIFSHLHLPSLPTFPFCLDNRGWGETMPRVKARGCAAARGVWGPERGRWVRRPLSFTERGLEESDGGFLSREGEFGWGACIESWTVLEGSCCRGWAEDESKGCGVKSGRGLCF